MLRVSEDILIILLILFADFNIFYYHYTLQNLAAFEIQMYFLTLLEII